MSTSPAQAATAGASIASLSSNGTSRAAASKEEEEERRLRERIQAKMQSRRGGSDGKQMSSGSKDTSLTEGGRDSAKGGVGDNREKKERTSPITKENGGAEPPLSARKKRAKSPSPVDCGKVPKDEKGRRRRRRRGRSTSPARPHRGHDDVVDPSNGGSNSNLDRRSRGRVASSREVRHHHHSSRDGGPLPPHHHHHGRHQRHHHAGDGGGYPHGRYPQGPPLPRNFRGGYPNGPPPPYYPPRGVMVPPPHMDHPPRGSPRMYPAGGGEFADPYLQQHPSGSEGQIVDDFGRVRMVRSYRRRPPTHQNQGRGSRSRSRSRSASHSSGSRTGSSYADDDDDYSRSDGRGSRSSSASRSDSRSRSHSRSTASASPEKGFKRSARRIDVGRRGRSHSRSESSHSRSSSRTSSSDSRSNHGDESSISTDDDHDDKKPVRGVVERKRMENSDASVGKRHAPLDASNSNTDDRILSTTVNPPVQEEERNNQVEEEDESCTKDQRTIFVSQLVMRTSERDLQRFFRRHGCPVNEVSWLRDKRTGRHKGSAYVELKRKKDVVTAINLSGQAPDFQRFPILIKACEASEQNYGTTGITAATAAAVGVAGHSTGLLVGGQMQPHLTGLTPVSIPRVLGPNGKYLEAQKVYVGSLDPAITQEHLIVLFRPLGQLLKVSLQVDTTTGISKGFAFLTYADAAEANLAIQTMAGQVLAGRPIKTGWAANQVSSCPNTELVTSDKFPPDASIRAQRAYQVLAQLTLGLSPAAVVANTMTSEPPEITQQRQGGLPVAMRNSNTSDTPTSATFLTGSSLQTSTTASAGTSRVPTVAEARASLAAAAAASATVVGPTLFQRGIHGATTVPVGSVMTSAAPDAVTDPFKIGNADHPTSHILVHNMFNKDEETEEGWADEIRQEFEEECSKFGSILAVSVQSEEPGGKIYASFDSIQAAQNCASSLAGRWFDKRQLRVEFVDERSIPPTASR